MPINTDIVNLYGNTALRTTINQLLIKNEYPKFTILCGPMGVGKSTMAMIAAKHITSKNTEQSTSIHTINCATNRNIAELESNFFRFSTLEPIVFIFEEVHGLSKDNNEQTMLLNILDNLPDNIYIIATTTELFKIQRPIVSRSIKFEFKLLTTKEMNQLIESYIKGKNISFSSDVISALVHTAKGIPRDLLKTVDLIIKGELSNEQIFNLVEYVSDNSLFAIFSSLKSEAVSFSLVITDLMLTIPNNQVQSMRDFWSRFILISKGSTEITIDKNIFNSLNNFYNNKEVTMITEMLLNTNESRLILDLLYLNMKLTNTSNKDMVGVQKVMHYQNTIENIEQVATISNQSNQKLTKQSLQQFKLNKGKEGL